MSLLLLVCFATHTGEAQSNNRTNIESNRIAPENRLVDKGGNTLTTFREINGVAASGIQDVTESVLVASYSFNGDLLDEVGVSHGTNHGAFFGTDRFGNPSSAVCFDGLESFINLGDLNMPDEGAVAEDVTHTMWFKIDPESGGGGIFTRRTDEWQAYLTFYYNPNQPNNMQRIEQRYPQPDPSNPSIVLVPEGPFYLPAGNGMSAVLGEWQHAAFSKKGTEYVIHINGELVATYTDSYDFTFEGDYAGFGDAIMGEAPAWSTDDHGRAMFKGCVDDLRVYEGGLSDDGIMDEFEETRANLWAFEMTAIHNDFYATVTMGMADDATDGLDPEIDTPEPPPAENPVRAYFYRPEWDGSLTDYYIADIREFRDLSIDNETWEVTLFSDEVGEVDVFFERFAEYDLSVTVRNSDGDVILFNEDDYIFGFSYESDGETAETFFVTIGAMIPPDLYIGDNFNGPALWYHGIDRELTWEVIPGSAPLTVTIEFASDFLETYTEIFSDDGSANSFLFDVPFIEYTYFGSFRITVTDGVTELVYVTEEPITIADNTQIVEYSAGWQLVSSPFESNVTEADEENSPFFLFNWNGYAYEQNEFISEYYGYWLGGYSDGFTTATGTIFENDLAVMYGPGWNLIGSPIFRMIYADSLVVTSDGISYSYEDAISEGLITAAYEFTGMGYEEAEDVIPFVGYWLGVIAEDGVMVTYPIHRFTEDPDLFTSDVSDDEIFALISVEDGALKQELRLGTNTRMKPIPPAGPDGNIVGLLGQESVLGNLYMETLISKDETTETQLRARGNNRQVKISWDGQDFLDLNFKIRMSDGSEHDLTRSGSVIWNTANTAPVIVSGPETTSAENLFEEIPLQISLSQNYPNPFNPTTTIGFAIPESGVVTLKVYNMLGHEVKTLISSQMNAGSHTVTFDASNLASGMYFYRLESRGIILGRTMMLIK